MNVSKYIASINNQEINPKMVRKLQKIYKADFPETIQRIISNSKNAVFFDGKSNYRAISFDEMVNAEKDLDVDFINLGFLLLFDCGDNDFIVYNFKKDYYCFFNIVDETSFRKKETLGEILV